jgi:hypothetical protein
MLGDTFPSKLKGTTPYLFAMLIIQLYISFSIVRREKMGSSLKVVAVTTGI